MSVCPVWIGAVDKAGKLTLADRDALSGYLRGLIGPVELVIRKRRAKRSDPQNRYYWGVVIALTAEYCGYQPEEMHDAWKLKLLRQEDPDHPMPTIRSTTSLSTQEFEDYLERIRTIAATDLGVVIPLPNEAVAA